MFFMLLRYIKFLFLTIALTLIAYSVAIYWLYRSHVESTDAVKLIYNCSNCLDDSSRKTITKRNATFPKCKVSPCGDRSIEPILEQRRRNIKEVCQKYQPKGTKVNWGYYLERRNDLKAFLAEYIHQTPPKMWWNDFMSSDMLKLIYCSVSKVANTNVKNYLYHYEELLTNRAQIAGDREDLMEIHTYTNLRKNCALTRLDFIDNKPEIDCKWRNYLKMVILRDPLDRLLSAYKDKLIHWNDEDYYKNLAVEMIRKIRPGFENQSSVEILKGKAVSFMEFLKYLDIAEDASVFDQHWRPQHLICNLCNVDFDYIGVMGKSLACEVEQFAQSITQQCHVPKMLQVGVGNGKERSRTNSELLTQVSESLLRDVLRKHYEVDYKMVGIDIDSIIKL